MKTLGLALFGVLVGIGLVVTIARLFARIAGAF